MFHDGRLLSEYGRPKTGGSGGEDDVGHILVLSPLGETLQVWKAPDSTRVESMTEFGGQLLVLLEKQIVTQRQISVDVFATSITTDNELIVLETVHHFVEARCPSL